MYALKLMERECSFFRKGLSNLFPIIRKLRSGPENPLQALVI